MGITSSETEADTLPPPITPRSGVSLATPFAHPEHDPHEKPFVTIQPGKSWAALNLGESWAYRELFYFLVWRDIKVRYKQTVIGVSWVVMQPLLTTLIFTVFLGILAGVQSDGPPYPVFVFSGLLPWTFFAGAIQGGGNSLVGNSHLITKVYFPRLIIPAASIGARLLDFAIAFLVLLALMLFYRLPVTWSILMLVPLVLLITLLALGIGLWTSALNVKYRDISAVLPLFVQLWMFASPVVYPTTRVPARWQTLYALNPLVGIIEGFRAALFGRNFDWRALSISAAITLSLLVYSAYAFKRMEKSFADII